MEEQDQSSDVPATEGPGGGYVAAPAIVMIAAVLFALAGIAGSIVLVVRDGYRRVPTR